MEKLGRSACNRGDVEGITSARERGSAAADLRRSEHFPPVRRAGSGLRVVVRSSGMRRLVR